jgi:hypothetical protein
LWIAGLYDIPLSDLMNWNGLDNNSIIRTEQKLLLIVTLPVTPTLTPEPPTITPSPRPSITQPPTTGTPTVTATESPSRGFNPGLFLGVIAIVLGIGGLLWWRFPRRR